MIEQQYYDDDRELHHLIARLQAPICMVACHMEEVSFHSHDGSCDIHGYTKGEGGLKPLPAYKHQSHGHQTSGPP